jgi:hypothetical protein
VTACVQFKAVTAVAYNEWLITTSMLSTIASLEPKVHERGDPLGFSEQAVAVVAAGVATTIVSALELVAVVSSWH